MGRHEIMNSLGSRTTDYLNDDKIQEQEASAKMTALEIAWIVTITATLSECNCNHSQNLSTMLADFLGL